ncbi:nonribosomal peptide synthetase 12 [Marasmius fiardii PR-910]|nr:nonribosomal peptide synthetase 12 [Marasmius fiardii PR-910]
MSLLDDLSKEDRNAFFRLGLGDVVPALFSRVHDAFDHYASLYPSNIAVENFEEQITYAELDRQANHLASYLQSLGITRGSRVCLLVERSIYMVIGILGILKAGGGYVPLDGNVVSDKTLHHVLRDSKAGAVLVMRSFMERIPISDIPVICLEDALSHESSTDGAARPQSDASTDDTVYIIYTSGTTGVPKGVDVKHGNVTNLVCLPPGNLGLAPGRRVSQLLNISFDMAQWEILGCLSNGATLCLRGKTSKQWKAVMKTVQVIIATPSMLVPHSPTDYPNVKVVAVAGEPCPISVADSWGASAQFYNCCGPTEVTIVNTMQLHASGSALSIGKPTPNNNVYVLDEDMKPVPIGKQGIMWAGGAGISRGYLNLPEKTNERYKRDPFVDDGSMMFNTGDLGRWMPHGGLEVLGRIDDQVKIKGFRVELDGVAAAMESYPGIKVSVALLVDGDLWGFVAPGNIEQASLIAHVSKIQPYYAVPTQVLAMDQFPKTANGKNDKRALRQLAVDQIEREKVSAVAPTPEIPPEISQAIVSLLSSPQTLERTFSISLPSHPQPVHIQISTGLSASLETRNAVLATSSLPSTSSSTLPSQESLADTRLGDEKVKDSSNSSPATSAPASEKGLAWEGYKDDELPEKTQGHYLRNLRHQIFSLYRRLFGVVFIANMAIFIATCVKGASVPKIGEIVVANLFCAILMRQDYVINAFFNTFCAVPASWPLAIRRVCARVYHIGGLHSGAAISGVVWLCLFTARATKDVVEGGRTSIPTLVMTWLILALLFGIVIFTHPAMRSKRHDSFERVHRFVGWIAAAMVWAQVVLLINDYKLPGQTLGNALKTNPSFWLVVIFTVSLILPWLRLRKVDVRAEVLSNHAVRLYFDYGVTPIAGSFVRISESPLFEWHGFATIPEPGKSGYSLVVSRAGDWTSKQIVEPPKKLWIRGIPTFGVLRIVPLFNRLVFVATGSGIGPCAPCILEQRVPIRLLWTSPNVRETFGDQLVDDLLEKSPDAVIYDTRKHGKPDMVKLTYRLVREFNAEAVCIISNQKLTQKVVYGMMSRGIPAFGAIWDS